MYYDKQTLQSKKEQAENKDKLKEVRQQIIKRYHIPEEHVISLPVNEFKRARDICVFYILKNKQLPNKIYYADGFVPHGYLLDKILESFGQEIGVNQISDLNEEFFKQWIIYKGFIDPYQQGFQRYKQIEKNIRLDLLKQAEENRLDPQTIEKIKNNQPVKLPNWFTAYVSNK